MAKSKELKTAEAAAKTARQNREATWGAWSEFREANRPLIDALGATYHNAFHRPEGYQAFFDSLGKEVHDAMYVLGNCYNTGNFNKPGIMLAAYDTMAASGKALAPLPAREEFEAFIAAGATHETATRDAEAALLKANQGTFTQQLKDAGFTAGSALADLDKVVRVQHGAKWDFWAVSKTGGRYLVRNGTRPYCWCTLGDNLSGFFTTGAQHYTVRGVSCSFKHAITEE